MKVLRGVLLGLFMIVFCCGDVPNHVRGRIVINIAKEEAVWELQDPILLRLAYTMSARQKGLMGIKKIPDNCGMLFIYPEERVLNFWMANCLTDIDVLFVNQSGIIVALHEMKKEKPRLASESVSDYHARLKRYSSGEPARFAIELAPGKINALGLVRGQRIVFEQVK